MITFGKMRHSNPPILNNKFGLSLEYTLTKLFSHSTVVIDLGNLFLISQNTARPLKIFLLKTNSINKYIFSHLKTMMNSQIDIVFHQTHSSITRPTLLIVVTDDILIVGIRMFGQVSLNQIFSLVRCESVI